LKDVEEITLINGLWNCQKLYRIAQTINQSMDKYEVVLNCLSSHLKLVWLFVPFVPTMEAQWIRFEESLRQMPEIQISIRSSYSENKIVFKALLKDLKDLNVDTNFGYFSPTLRLLALVQIQFNRFFNDI
jgi:hypothetical protein